MGCFQKWRLNVLESVPESLEAAEHPTVDMDIYTRVFIASFHLDCNQSGLGAIDKAEATRRALVLVTRQEFRI